MVGFLVTKKNGTTSFKIGGSIFFVFMLFTIFVFYSALNPALAKNNDKVFQRVGDILQIAVPASAYIATFVADDNEGRNQFYTSLAANLLITYGLKYSINRTRPDGGGASFPSGHTSSAFQGAAFIHRRYGIKYAAPAYIAGVLVAASRVDADRHHLSDVVAGAVLGIAVSFYFTTPNMKFVPKFEEGEYSVEFGYKF